MTGMKYDAALSEHFVQRLIASQCVTVSSCLCWAQTFYIFKVVFVNIIKESNKQLQSTKKVLWSFGIKTSPRFIVPIKNHSSHLSINVQESILSSEI